MSTPKRVYKPCARQMVRWVAALNMYDAQIDSALRFGDMCDDHKLGQCVLSPADRVVGNVADADGSRTSQLESARVVSESIKAAMAYNRFMARICTGAR